MRLGMADVRAAFEHGLDTCSSLELASDLKALRYLPARCQIVGAVLSHALMNAAQRPRLPGNAAVPSDRLRDLEQDRMIANGKNVVKPGHRQDTLPEG